MTHSSSARNGPVTPAAATRRGAGTADRGGRPAPVRGSAAWPAELLTPAQMAAVDAAAVAAGFPLAGLMQAAGRAVARSAMRHWRPRRTLVLAGPGNNGGDGWVAARLLAEAGWPVSVAALPVADPSGAAGQAVARWRGPLLPLCAEVAERAELVIDALFGAGLSRPLSEEVAAVLRAIRAPVLAVDMPSGLDGGTGAPLGFVRPAAVTVTFVRRKPGHLLLPGRDLCGRLELADLGLPEAVVAGVLGQAEARSFSNGPALWRLPHPAADTHKHARGHVVVAAGSRMPGAARLAAAAARRAGAGMVTLAATSAGAAFLLRGAVEPGQIVADPPAEAILDGGRARSWALGPGLPPDERTARLLDAVLAAGAPAVVDAGALTVCAGQPERLRGAAVLTPHAGEFARVFGAPGPDRPAAARRAAALCGAAVVLKGSDTVIAAPDGRVAINGNAPPTLATAGTGDVLAGSIAALLAQGMPPFEAAAAGVWVHGAAASPAPGLIAEDLIDRLPGVLAGLFEKS
ncbi:NAD(P)H-hydrate dehydratase [Roseomonas sp. BN140053]|uniref:NAD(P)H-hydrate dehydratase n=1 Tax=Roseomonas sp. BN140053 TaxID=3391898 RepID=UPI0039EB8D0E